MHPTETGHKKLRDLYPAIERLSLFVAFEEADADAEPNYQQIIFTEDSAAAFRLECSRDDCVDGGFDYEPFIAELIDSGEQQAQGRITCPGTLASDENRSCCKLQSEYRIILQRNP